MNICIFGDSITWGASDEEKGGWTERMKLSLMKRGYDHVYNLGIPGDNTVDLLKRFEVEAFSREPDMILFAIGINDSQYIGTRENCRVSLDVFKMNIIKLIDMARKITDKIVFVGLTRVDESKTMPLSWSVETYYDNEGIEIYDNVLKNICDEHALRYINMKGSVDVLSFEDGLHPNAGGHEKMFQVILGAIETFMDAEKRNKETT